MKFSSVILCVIFFISSHFCFSSEKKEETVNNNPDSSAVLTVPRKNEKNTDEDEFKQPVFQLKNWDKDLKKPEVEEDNSNVVIEKKSPDEDSFSEKDKTEQCAPPQSLAGRISTTREKILWTPKWHFEGTGGVRIPEAALSPDESLIAIVETTGTNQGPSGSRLVLINTYDWKILRIHNFPENKISQICFIPEQMSLAFWSEKQASIKKPYELIIAGLIGGEVTALSKEIKTPVSDIIASKKFIFVKPVEDSGEEGKIFVFLASDISGTAKKMQSGNTRGIFALSQDMGILSHAGNRFIEMINLSSGEMTEKIELDQDYSADALTFAGKNNWLAVSNYQKPAFLFKGSFKKEICGISGHILFYNDNFKSILLEQYVKNQFSFYSVPELEEISSFVPGSLLPRTCGSATFVCYLKHHQKYFVIDSFGNMCLYYKPEKSKKWKKSLILCPKK